MQAGTAAVERVFRQEYGRLIASLVGRFGDIDIAQEAAGEALLAAVEKWPGSTVPANPGGWLTTTAGNRAIDRIRRESKRDAKHQAAFMEFDDTADEPTGPVEEDRLRLLFTCCHPALAPEARIALSLRLLGGLTVAEIAQAFLVPEAADLPERLSAVLAVLFLVFKRATCYRRRRPGARRAHRRGHRSDAGPAPAAPRGAGGGRIARTAGATDARREARVRNGQLVPIGEQDRAGWDRTLIGEGHDLVRECLTINRPGRYQVLAAINAVHTDAPAAPDTDWSQVVALYDQLTRPDPSPIVALNRAVAIADLDGPTVALALVDRLPLTGYHAWHAARADLLRRLGCSAESREAYDAAIAATQNCAERAYLSRKRGELV